MASRKAGGGALRKSRYLKVATRAKWRGRELIIFEHDSIEDMLSKVDFGVRELTKLAARESGKILGGIDFLASAVAELRLGLLELRDSVLHAADMVHDLGANDLKPTVPRAAPRVGGGGQPRLSHKRQIRGESK